MSSLFPWQRVGGLDSFRLSLCLEGRAVNPDRKDAVENPVAWTWKNRAGGRVFTTTLGHPEDFQVAAFQRLVINAIHWALGRPIPERWAGKIEVAVPYHGIRKTAERK